jgi:hypothetical protein
VYVYACVFVCACFVCAFYARRDTRSAGESGERAEGEKRTEEERDGEREHARQGVFWGEVRLYGVKMICVHYNVIDVYIVMMFSVILYAL